MKKFLVLCAVFLLFGAAMGFSQTRYNVQAYYSYFIDRTEDCANDFAYATVRETSQETEIIFYMSDVGTYKWTLSEKMPTATNNYLCEAWYSGPGGRYNCSAALICVPNQSYTVVLYVNEHIDAKFILTR